jgi:hypothetical protein
VAAEAWLRATGAALSPACIADGETQALESGMAQLPVRGPFGETDLCDEAIAVFGTMVADAMHVGLGIPYKVSVTLFAVALAVVFVAWYRTEHTLSIHSITTLRREFFYWRPYAARSPWARRPGI